MTQSAQDRSTRHGSVQNQLKSPQPGKLGTFAGVFTPSVLTILGIILFLRLGYVTGSAGIYRALIIIAIANLISILTSQSLAAIATNLKVKGGGDYYLISRTLGHQFGGAIGMVLYLAQSVSVAFYCIGFAEALTAMIPGWSLLTPRLVAAIAVGLLFVLAWLGADWATRFQYGVMVLLIAALFSFYAGGLTHWEATIFKSNWTAPEDAPSFWIIFGIFFPAVTGFTQGVSMSGDLKNPGKSLPLGTFLAVGISIVVYFSVAIVFAGVLPNAIMVEDYQSIKRVARYGFLIDAGVIAATLSSAMASFMGGPRILQSLAADRVFPFLSPFSKGTGPTGNPRRAILLTLTIAMITIGLGQLNLVARVVSMFFLISYALLNYATFYEARTKSPSFRPRFKWFNKYLSLLGCLMCAGIILALDVKNGVIALAILFAIHYYLKQTAGPTRWADSTSAHAFQVIRKQLTALTRTPEHHRNWRPHILVFTNHTERREALFCFAQWLEGQSGLITAVQMIEGTGARARRKQQEAEAELNQKIAEHDFNIFPLVVTAEDIPSSLPVMLQSYGIGQLNANTILTNWYGQSAKAFGSLQALKYGHNLRVAYRLGYNLVVFRYDQTRWETLLASPGEERRIDVWWQADATSRLMLLLAYLTTRNEEWEKAHIRVLTTGTGQRLEKAKEDMVQMLEEIRIDARAEIVPDLNPDTVVEASADSSLIFLPFRIRSFKLMDVAGYSLDRVLHKLPATALVMAAEDIDLDAEPEEGASGELAEAMDKLKEAERRAAKTAKADRQAKKRVAQIKTEIDAELEKNERNDERLSQLYSTLIKAEQAAESAFRKSAKNETKVEDAARQVHNLGGPSPDTSPEGN